MLFNYAHLVNQCFPIIGYPFFDDDVPLSPSYCVYIYINLFDSLVYVTACLISTSGIFVLLDYQGFRFHRLVETFVGFYHRYKDIIRRYKSTCKHLIRLGISHTVFYDSVLCRSKTCRHSPQKLTKPLNTYSERICLRYCCQVI